jgi:hypothetical protein
MQVNAVEQGMMMRLVLPLTIHAAMEVVMTTQLLQIQIVTETNQRSRVHQDCSVLLGRLHVIPLPRQLMHHRHLQKMAIITLPLLL